MAFFTFKVWVMKIIYKQGGTHQNVILFMGDKSPALPVCKWQVHGSSWWHVDHRYAVGHGDLNSLQGCKILFQVWKMWKCMPLLDIVVKMNAFARYYSENVILLLQIYIPSWLYIDPMTMIMAQLYYVPNSWK